MSSKNNTNVRLT